MLEISADKNVRFERGANLEGLPVILYPASADQPVTATIGEEILVEPCQSRFFKTVPTAEVASHLKISRRGTHVSVIEQTLAAFTTADEAMSAIPELIRSPHLQDQYLRTASSSHFFDRPLREWLFYTYMQRMGLRRIIPPGNMGFFMEGDYAFPVINFDPSAAFGDDLSKIIRGFDERSYSYQPRTPKNIGRILKDLEPVARDLDQAHTLGVIHRDIKPANILYDTDGNEGARLADLGQTAFMGATDWRMLGSPYYAAPEVFTGNPLSRAADLYSWNRVLLELLIGAKGYTTERAGGSLLVHIDPHMTEFVRLFPRLRECAPRVYDVLEAGNLTDPQDRLLEAESCLSQTRALQRALEPIVF